MITDTLSLGFHITCRLVDSRVIAPSAGQRRTLARVVHDKTRQCQLLAFNAADTHLHLELAGTRVQCTEAARRVELALGRRLQLPVGFERMRLTAVRDQHHLANTFDYILRQEQRHGLEPDPWFEGSNLPELLGLRVLPSGCVTAVRSLLPRICRQQLLRYLGVDSLSPLPLAALLSDADEALSTPTDRAAALRRAALRASGCCSLRGLGPRHIDLRRALIAVAHPVLGCTELSRILGIDPRSVRRGRAHPADPRLVRAIQCQLDLWRQLQSQRPQQADHADHSRRAATGAG